MRFDMHCHTRDGSVDGQIDIQDYVRILKQKGFQGMLVTDHNTYKGYRAWLKYKKENKLKEDFVVLKGVEYDTLDAGHILVIMPQGLRLRILEVRGLPVRMLIEIVHKYGGILGPAHPYGAKFLGAMNSIVVASNPRLIQKFDFVEVFNTCETKESTQKARALAQFYKKRGIGGSDSHRHKYVGTAYTDINYPIKNNNDLIYAIKNGYVLGCGGEERQVRRTSVIKRILPIGPVWKIFNRSLAILNKRNHHISLLQIFHGKN